MEAHERCISAAILFLSLLLPVRGALNQNGFNIEVYALYSFKQGFEDPQNALSSWDKNAVDPCNWIHIQCSQELSVISVDLPNLQLSGQLSPYIGELANLQYLLLQSNNFSGPIPPELGNCTKLHTLDLSDNHFSSSIPDIFRNLKGLGSLRLNNNSLTGPLPSSLANISTFEFVDVSFNNLSGSVPNITAINNNVNVLGNPLLCGLRTSKVCPGDPPRPLEPLSAERGSSRTVNKAALGSGLAIALLFVVASLSGFLWWRRHHNQQVFFDVNEQQDPDIALGQLKKFSFQELQIATDNFDQKNILGRGGFGNVYKGCLSDGTFVAVKRLKEEGINSGEYQFQMEVELISLAVHRNLLRLRGFCMTPTERLLVYPYMPNGSVASRLKDIVCGKPALDWPTRKRIALGSARGLLYLHEHCDPKIIHRDVKAANILLDEDFEAVVGDFGLAKLLDHRDSHVTTAVRGTVGHIAPEYLSTGQSSEKTDVFGFGILLLELIRGQRAFDFGGNKDVNVMLLDWVKQLQQAKNLDRLIDGELRGNYNEVELDEMVQVALLCTQMFPADRPRMSEVVRMFEGDGLAERWEEWQKVETIRSRETQLIPRRYYELVEDSYSSSDLEAVDLSGPRQMARNESRKRLASQMKGKGEEQDYHQQQQKQVQCANAEYGEQQKQQQQQQEDEGSHSSDYFDSAEEDEDYEEDDDDEDEDEYDDDDDELSTPVTPSARYQPHPSPVAANGMEANDRPLRVYADGIYDLFHFGHARSLEQAKKLFPNTYLLVGCCSDSLTHKYKGKTVMTEAERYESLRHCRWVDEVIEDAPWVITQEFIDEHKIDFVAHDALPYVDVSGAGKDVYEFVKAAGKFKETKRTDGVSTSDLIMRIIKDYNEYVMRNLARGYSRKDLGVSYVKEKQLQVNMGMRKLRQKVKEQQERLNTVAKTAGMHHSEWVENADRWVAGFLEKFEESCHLMENAITTRIKKGLMQRPRLKKRTNANIKLLLNSNSASF